MLVTLSPEWLSEHLKHITIPWLKNDPTVIRAEIYARLADWESLHITYSLN